MIITAAIYFLFPFIDTITLCAFITPVTKVVALAEMENSYSYQHLIDTWIVSATFYYPMFTSN